LGKWLSAFIGARSQRNPIFRPGALGVKTIIDLQGSESYERTKAEAWAAFDVTSHERSVYPKTEQIDAFLKLADIRNGKFFVSLAVAVTAGVIGAVYRFNTIIEL